jgi:nucleoside-diphosphate-sugar epimerase
MKAEFSPAQKEQKVFITGATGFIGSALTRRLVSLGFQNIYCLYRRERKRDRIFKGVDTHAITFLKGDIAQHDVLRQGLDGAAIVVNCAAKANDWGSRWEFRQVNLEGPKAILGMLDEQQAPTQYIELTSGSIYGFAPTPKTENSPLVKSDHLYTASKIELHRWLRGEMLKNRLTTITILAPPLVWGPGDQIYVPMFIDQLIKRQLIYIGHETQALDFIHIDDLIDSILLCIFNPQAYNTEFILNGPAPFSLKRLIDHIAEIAGLPPPLQRRPIAAMNAYALLLELTARLINLYKPEHRPRITRFQVNLFSRPMNLSAARARAELGFHPRIDFERGKSSIEDDIRVLSRFLRSRM